MALVLIDEARTLEKNSKGYDVPSLQRAAAKYQEAASNIEGFVVEQQERQSGSDESATKDLLEKSSMYAKQGEELCALASSLTSIRLEEDLDPGEFAGSRDSESGTLPPAGGGVQVAAKCHGAVPYSKTHVRQHDRQRVSCESLDDIPDLALEIEVPAWWSDSESLANETPESVTLLDQDLVNYHEGTLDCLDDFAGYCKDEDGYDEYSSDLESISSDASFLVCQGIIDGEPPQRKSNAPPPIVVAAMQGEHDLESHLNEPLERPILLAGKPPKKKSRLTTELDYSREIEPTEHDVLHGRGEHTNRHPGNVIFRKKVQELLPKYMESSNKEKYLMSVELMQSVTSKGHRFLGEEDGKWYRVIDPRRKASQAFRPKRSPNQATAPVEREDLDPISMRSEAYKNENPFDHRVTEFLGETTIFDEPADCQPLSIDGTGLVIDLSRPIDMYGDNDVLFGKDDKIKNHPGNVRFRQKAEELLERYNRCSKENNKVVALELVHSITGDGNFFLAMGPGDKWYPVVNDAPRRKASQKFRDIRNAQLKRQKLDKGC
jgi:hypothetical protein